MNIQLINPFLLEDYLWDFVSKNLGFTLEAHFWDIQYKNIFLIFFPSNQNHGLYKRWLLIYYAHTWSNSGISKSKESSNSIFFSKKDLVYIILIMNQLFSQALMGYGSGKSPMGERVKKA